MSNGTVGATGPRGPRGERGRRGERGLQGKAPQTLLGRLGMRHMTLFERWLYRLGASSGIVLLLIYAARGGSLS